MFLDEGEDDQPVVFLLAHAPLLRDALAIVGHVRFAVHGGVDRHQNLAGVAALKLRHLLVELLGGPSVDDVGVVVEVFVRFGRDGLAPAHCGQEHPQEEARCGAYCFHGRFILLRCLCRGRDRDFDLLQLSTTASSNSPRLPLWPSRLGAGCLVGGAWSNSVL